MVDPEIDTAKEVAMLSPAQRLDQIAKYQSALSKHLQALRRQQLAKDAVSTAI